MLNLLFRVRTKSFSPTLVNCSFQQNHRRSAVQKNSADIEMSNFLSPTKRSGISLVFEFCFFQFEARLGKYISVFGKTIKLVIWQTIKLVVWQTIRLVVWKPIELMLWKPTKLMLWKSIKLVIWKKTFKLN